MVFIRVSYLMASPRHGGAGEIFLEATDSLLEAQSGDSGVHHTGDRDAHSGR
jgi:hypothetical protein